MIRNLRKDFNKNFALSDTGDNTKDPLNGRDTSDSLLLRTLLVNLPTPKVSAKR